MICPITCGCRNSLVDIMENTRVVSHILRVTRKILENELIACFGHTAAIPNKDEIIQLKKAQQDRNSNICRSSIYGARESPWKRGLPGPPPGCDPTSKRTAWQELTEELNTT